MMPFWTRWRRSTTCNHISSSFLHFSVLYYDILWHPWVRFFWRQTWAHLQPVLEEYLQRTMSSNVLKRGAKNGNGSIRDEKLGHIGHINYIVPSSMASFIIHDSSICTQLIWFSWSGWNEGSHMKFQWFCHCSKSGGHYIHVVSSDWASQRSGKQHCGNARDAVLEAQTCSSRNFNIIWTISFQWPYLKQQHPGSSFLHAKMHLPASMPGNGAIAS